MKVKEIMTSPVEEIQSDETVLRAAKMMKMFNIGALPVMKDDEVVGILTDRDIVVRCIAAGLDPTKTPVSKVMTKEAICCSEDSDIQNAAAAMEDNKVHRLLVFSDTEQICGILSIADVVRKVKDDRLIHEILECICEPVPA